MNDNELSYYFISILTKGKKDNTYKFALGRFLIEYAKDLQISYIHELEDKNENEVVPYSVIAKKFLKYYWHQICKYKIRQNYNIAKLPLIVQIIQRIFGTEYIPQPYSDMDENKITTAENEIARMCFSEVIPRFQNIVHGTQVISNNIFYDYQNNKITIKPEVLRFFKQNHSLLFKAVILEWSKFLERINYALPKLISKVEKEDVMRTSLEKYKSLLSGYFDRCFYCNTQLSKMKQLVHVDHFIPWSYIFEDELWNLVLTCRNCNLKKHASLPPERYIELLFTRNRKYSSNIQDLRKSIQRLEVNGNQLNSIIRHYQNCIEYGFTPIDF